MEVTITIEVPYEVSEKLELAKEIQASVEILQRYGKHMAAEFLDSNIEDIQNEIENLLCRSDVQQSFEAALREALEIDQ